MDASTLTVTALNVGMNAEDSFKNRQGVLRAQLAGTIIQWLAGQGAAAVALNEIHSNIAEKLLRELGRQAPEWNIQKATSSSNSLLWRAPSVVYLPLRALFT